MQIKINDIDFDLNDLLNINKLQRQLLIEQEKYFTTEQCVNIWSNYSNDLAASWLLFPKEENEILRQIKSSDYFSSFEEYAN